jgi:hypothetical protein
MRQEVRMAFVVVTFPKGSRALLDVVSVLSEFESILIGSIQVPDKGSDNIIFGILVRATMDELGALTGPLGKIYEVKVKSAVLSSEE